MAFRSFGCLAGPLPPLTTPNGFSELKYDGSCRGYQPPQKSPQARADKQPPQPLERLRDELLRGEEPVTKAPHDFNRVWGFFVCRPPVYTLIDCSASKRYLGWQLRMQGKRDGSP
jgi:hypothetical protein